MRRAVTCLAALLLALAGAAPAAAQFGGMGGGGPPKVPPRREDIPFIKCQVCEHLAKNAYKQVREMMKSSTPSKKVDELQVIEAMEKVTSSWQPEGEWMEALHIEQRDGRLLLKDMGKPGECGEVCRTVELAAEEIVGEHDTDMAEALYAGKKSRAQFNNWLCYELTGVCNQKPPPVPKDRKPSPDFKPRDAGAPNIERMMKQMEAAGLKGSLYDREQMMKMAAEAGADEGLEDLAAAGSDGAAAEGSKTEL